MALVIDRKIKNTFNGETKIEVKLENETLWLSQKQMTELFSCRTNNVLFHLQNIFKEAELNENQTTQEYCIVQKSEIT